MGSLWRSEEMCLCQLFLQSEATFQCVSALGELGLVQFQDLNSEVNAYQRKYVNELRRCDEMNRKLRFFEKEVTSAAIRTDAARNALTERAPDTSAMQALDVEFDQIEKELVEINKNQDELKAQELHLLEMKEILQKTSQFFDSNDINDVASRTNEGTKDDSSLLRSAKEERSGKLGFVTGVIPREKAASFERLVWRACRGNVFTRIMSMDNIKTEVDKDIFIIFFQGATLESLVMKICVGFSTTVYPCPDTMRERRALGEEVQTRLDDLSQVLGTTREHLRKILSRIAYQLSDWQVKVTKIKAIFHTMNKFSFDANRSSLIGNCWCPTNQLGAIREALRQGAQYSGTGAQPILTQLQTKKQPPTYHVTNKFTGAFQAIVDAYGVASYQEVNPGPFTIITFPFLFAVMFGDLGHGFIMFLFALWMVKREISLSEIKGGGEIWDTIFGGRYILLLMGMFSMYTGILYNDCFSKAITIVPSGWELPNPCFIKDQQVEMMHLTREQLAASPYEPIANPFPGECGTLVTDLTLNPCDVHGCFKYAYPLGIDPVWMATSNKLSFTNSYKMKMSVIMGVLQMSFGVVLSYFNGKFFKRPDDVKHIFVPQICFLLGIFGYLVLMIFKKWGTDPADSPNPGSTPSLLLMLINMFLSIGTAPEPDQVLFGDKKGSFQNIVQVGLVFLAVICVPWMLLVKPMKIRAQIKADAAKKAHLVANDIEDEHVAHDDEDDAHHDFSEIMVHQAIHTIEFCLGCISNTASYLRLWALSLAHAELSEVLWEMVLEPGLSHAGTIQPLLLYCSFGAWAVLTICVLLIMEGLSAFLHALRLHWVEFQSKFYVGVGYLFRPFSFQLIIENGEDETN